jgi:hypothetical protein
MSRLLCFIGWHKPQLVTVRRPQVAANPLSVGLYECIRCYKIKTPFGWAKI